MPQRELRFPNQVEDWLSELSGQLTQPARLILIGSGALLWHAFQRGISDPLPENSMDVDPVTDSEEVARLCYEALIGTDFERKHGWHVNLMPDIVLRELPADWQSRTSRKNYGLLEAEDPALVISSPQNLSAMNRGTERTRLGPTALVC